MLPIPLLSKLLDAVGVAICGFDAEHRTTFWNQTFLEFFPEHDGHTYVGEPYAENLRRFYRARLGADELIDLERLVAEGVTRHASQQQPFEFTHHGRRLEAASMALEEGGRVRVWRLLSAAERAKVSGPIPAFDMLEHIPDGACVVDSDQRLVICNDAFRRLYDLPGSLAIVGLTLDDIIGRCWRSVSPAGELRASLRNQLRYDGAPFEVELPGGRWLRVIKRHHDAGSALCIHADISQLKRQQADLIEAQVALTAAYSELALAATQDSLTGLANRRLYSERFDALLALGVGLILIDVDDFKTVNDRFGHVVGDDVLRLVGLAISGAAEGKEALAARIGGEEFAVVAQSDLPMLLEIAHDLRDRLRLIDWSTVHPSLAQVTVSVGVGVSRPGAELRSFKEAVDEALYRAKRNGKDRIELVSLLAQAKSA